MPRVLVVDDRQTNRDFLSTLLGYKEYTVSEAVNGQEALDRFQSEKFDLVITDVLMPEVDGYELTRRLRADDLIEQPSIIFYTAHYVTSEAKKLADSCGVNFILDKPAAPELILNTVEQALKELAIRRPPKNEVPGLFDQKHVWLLTEKLHQKIAELEVNNRELQEKKACAFLADEPSPRHGVPREVGPRAACGVCE